jgi:hypothetical protein
MITMTLVPVDLWTALLRRVPAFALRAILCAVRGQPYGLPTVHSQAGGCPQAPPARKSISDKNVRAPGPWRTRFRSDGGQRSGRMADSIPG